MNTLSRTDKETIAKEEHTTNISNKTYNELRQSAKAPCKDNMDVQIQFVGVTSASTHF